jgi:hypothetical protein
MVGMDAVLPPPPGDADQVRVGHLRSVWTDIKPAGPVQYQTGWQIAKPDVMYLLDLAEEALRLRAEEAALREVVFSLDYAIGQWEQHGPPRGYDVLASFRDLLRCPHQGQQCDCKRRALELLSRTA